MPFRNQLHVDKLLSNVSVKYRNQDYLAMKIFPEVSVKESSNVYRAYERNFRIPNTVRAIGGVSREHFFEVSTANYNLEWHSLKDYVADRQADNYDLADLRSETVEELSDKILLRLEKSVMDLFTKTSWSNNVSLAAGAEFSANTTTSNPIPIFDTAASTIIAQSGLKPNFGVINRDTLVACKNHVSVLDRTKYVSSEMDEGMLAALFGLGELLVSNISYDSTNYNYTTTSIGPILVENAFVGYKPPSPGPLKASAGYIFRNNRPMVKRWRVEEREADAIEVNMEYQAKVVASLAGYLICNTT